MSNNFSYDVVPYAGNFQPQLHPDRMAAPAKLLAMKPAAVENCRYLELGCGTGENLINAAFSLPESEFVGVDLSKRHIAAAARAVEELNLKNVKFLNLDVMKINREEYGQFDYIAAHGLFSWVPDFVRRKILALYQQLLAPHGVAHISFNALPGGYLRQMMRDMMLYHTQNDPPSIAKEEKGAAFCEFLRDATERNEYYQLILKNETGSLCNRKAGGILHDEMSTENKPFYFHEFAESAARNDLQYLCDSEYYSLPLNIFPPSTQEFLDSFGDDILRREQYADFLLCRRFRNVLLCRADVTLNRRVEPTKLREFYVAAMIALSDEETELEIDKFVEFRAPSITSFSLKHPLSKIALAHLGGIWTDSIKFDDLMDISRRKMESLGVCIEDWEKTVSVAGQIFLELYKNSAVELRTYQAKGVREASAFPCLSLLTRRQLRSGNIVTTVNNNELELSSSFMRRLLLLLDGTRGKIDLKKELRKRIRAGEFSDFKEKSVLLEEFPVLFEKSLSKIAKAGLLVS